MPIDGNRIPCDPGFWPRQKAILAKQAIDQGRLAGIGPSDDCEFQWPERGLLVFALRELRCDLCGLGLCADDRPKRPKQISNTFAMFG